MLHIAARENKKQILRIKSQVSRLQTNKYNSAYLSELKLERKLFWNVAKSKGSFPVRIFFLLCSWIIKINTTKHSHQIWSVVQVHLFLPGKFLNWLQSRLNIEARIPQQASWKFTVLYSTVYLCSLVLVFFFLDISLTLFWHKRHLWDIQVRGLIFICLLSS